MGLRKTPILAKIRSLQNHGAIINTIWNLNQLKREICL